MAHLPRLRRTRLRLGAAVAGTSALVAFWPPGEARAAPIYGHHRSQPNVVLVLTDDQRWDTLWAMPTVQRELVRRGVSFGNAFVVNPLCCPSRVSILTGRYSHSTGVYGNKPPAGGFHAFRDRSTVATWMEAAGYETAYIGKYLNGAPAEYVPPGWDRWISFSAEPSFYAYGLNVDGAVRRHPRRPGGHSTDVLGEKAVEFIRHTSDRPFFLVFAPYAPHYPATPAPRHADTFRTLKPWRPPSYDEPDVSDKPLWLRTQPRLGTRERALDRFRRKQYASLLGVDEAVGNIVAALRREDRLNNTVIIFTSDNGLLWGEHRVPRAKWAAYEESIRVPLVIRYDNLVVQPRRDRRLVANIDLAPTIAELAGAHGGNADGRSLVSILTSPTTGGRRSLLIEHLVSGPARLSRPIPTYCALRTAGLKYVAYATAEEELYDLEADPHELDNRASDPDYRDRLLGMRKRLKARCVPPPPGFTTKWISTRPRSRR
jgi:N-acetylglucosamine-6-sulfatase